MLKTSKKESQVAPKKLSKKEIKKELLRQKDLVENVIIPILKSNAKSIKDAQNVIKSVLVGLDYKFASKMRAYQETMSAETLGQLDLKSELQDDKKSKTEYSMERMIIEALENEQVGTFKGLVQVTDKILENSIIKETIERPFDTLKLLS